MAEALFRRAIADRGISAAVGSAGSLTGGAPAAAGSVQVMAQRGLDLRAHRSRRATAADVAGADLVLGMGRSHCREAVVLHPPAWPYTFTLRELVRRGDATGPRRPGQPLEEWLAALGRGRTRTALLGEDAGDDIADPMGGPIPAYQATAVLLGDLVDRAVTLVFPEGPRSAGT
jgi:protein-tyrosine phosphatase